MSVLFVLVPAALVLVLIAVAAFVWAAGRGQYDDLSTPPLRALHEDAPQPRTPFATEPGPGLGRLVRTDPREASQGPVAGSPPPRDADPEAVTQGPQERDRR